jgi:Zn-dependent protease with chaperone function
MRINIFEFIDKVKRNAHILILLIFSLLFLFISFITDQPISFVLLLLVGVDVIIVWGAFFLPDKKNILQDFKVRKPNPQNPKEKKLMEIIEELSLGLGIKTPEVYLMKSKEINAFVAGRNIKDSCICITDKAVYELSKEELSALVAHELVRIKNNDARVVIASFIAAFGMFLISLFILLISAPGFVDALVIAISKQEISALDEPYIAMMGVMFIGLISILLELFMIKERVILADTESVKLTHDPEALANLLKKIKNINKGKPDMPGLFGEAGWVSYLFFVFPKEIDYKKVKEKLTTKQEMQEEESEATTSEQLKTLFRILPPVGSRFDFISTPLIDLSRGLFSPLFSASQEMEEERNKRITKESNKEIVSHKHTKKSSLLKLKERMTAHFYPTIDERIKILESL